jgi:hypothetical protein
MVFAMQWLGLSGEVELIQKRRISFNCIVPTNKIAPSGERKTKGTHYGSTP